MAFRKYKNVLSIILCLFLLISMYVPVSDFLMRKNSYEKNADFYNYEGNYDVLFLGTSHMVMGISPMELWNDYGITSYNLGDFGQTTAIDYWVLKNALDYTTPKLVVVDVYRINEVTKYVETYISQMHNVFDSMPLSKNKILLI